SVPHVSRGRLPPSFPIARGALPAPTCHSCIELPVRGHTALQAPSAKAAVAVQRHRRLQRRSMPLVPTFILRGAPIHLERASCHRETIRRTLHLNNLRGNGRLLERLASVGRAA